MYLFDAVAYIYWCRHPIPVAIDVIIYHGSFNWFVYQHWETGDLFWVVATTLSSFYRVGNMIHLEE